MLSSEMKAFRKTRHLLLHSWNRLFGRGATVIKEESIRVSRL